MLLSVLCMFLGFGSIFLCVKFAPVPFWLMSICWGVFGLGSGSAFYPTVLVIRGYFNPEHVGRLFSVGATVYPITGIVASALFSRQNSAEIKSVLEYFMLANCCAAGATLVLAFIVLRPPPQVTKTAFQDDDEEIKKALTVNSNEEERPLPPFWKTTWEMCKSAKFWLVMFSLTISFGISVNFYNNSGSIVLSLGGSNTAVAHIMICFAVAQIGGRLIYSVLQTMVMQRWGAFWYALLLLSSAVISISVSIGSYAINSVFYMYIFSIANGIAYGALWSMMPFVSFSAKMYPSALRRHNVQDVQIYGLVCYAPAIGPLIFDSISGYMYDRHTKGSSSNNCIGDVCYKDFFLLAAVLQVLVIIAIQIWVWMEAHSRSVRINREMNTVTGDDLKDRYIED